MDFGTKIKMARNGLGLNTSEFANICDLSSAGLNKIERLEGSPNVRTVQKIERVLNSLGWKLLENGVIKEDKIIIVYDDYLDVLEDIQKTLNDGEVVLFHRADDRRSSPEVIAKMSELKSKGIKFKSNICEDNNYIIGDLSDYRQINKEYFSQGDVEVIYSDRIVIHASGKTNDENTFFVIKNKELSNTRRKDFNYWWKNGKCLD